MPFELLFGSPPAYDHLRVFGCLCFPNMAATSTHKLSVRSVPCALLGYSVDHMGYQCFNLPQEAPWCCIVRKWKGRNASVDEMGSPSRLFMHVYIGEVDVAEHRPK
jgi:hypothetical protein